MLLTLTTTHNPATDLGYLLHKNPAKLHSFELSFGKAHVFYPEASSHRCTVALLLEVDPVGLVRGKRGQHEGGTLDQYVNDRPYAAPGIPFQRNAFRNRALYDFDLRLQKRFAINENMRLKFSMDVFNVFNLENIELGGSTVTNYCAPLAATPPGASSAIPRDCGFAGPTNVNFLSLRERRQGLSTTGNLLTTNTPTPQPFQLQFGARFEF